MPLDTPLDVICENDGSVRVLDGEVLVVEARSAPEPDVELPAPEPQGSVPAASIDPESEADSRIEIVLPDGTAVRVAEGISVAVLRRVLAALRG